MITKSRFNMAWINALAIPWARVVCSAVCAVLLGWWVSVRTWRNWVLNYVNPMGAVCTTVGRGTQMKMVGLCHGVQTTLDLIAGYTGAQKAEIDYLCAGINHMDWFLKLEKDGQDLYPLLCANIEKPEYYKNEKGRGEVMRHCGYFMTESTGHLSEYLPWFRKNQQVLDLYCVKPLDRDAVLNSARKVKALVTVEEHSVIGGMSKSSTNAVSGREMTSLPSREATIKLRLP